MDGILVINKEIDRTSRDIVNDLTHILKTKKIGHTGTLDPIARGVLIVTIGRYTKLNEVLMSTYKEYVATFKLGIQTDTLDITGNVISEEEVNIPDEIIRDAVLKFKGSYVQEVPAYSSVKVGGKKLYEYARENIQIELPSREVEIKEIDILSILDNEVKIRTVVSKGTYIRSLIRDIGVALKTNAVMLSLVRTKQGKFNIENSYTVEDVRNGSYKILGLQDVLDVSVIECDEEMYFKVSNGVKLDNNYDKEFVLFKYCDREIALYRKNEDKYSMYLKIEV